MWGMADVPVAPPLIPVLAERGGTQLKAPRATVLVDTREQNPFDFSRFERWFAGVEKRSLRLGDYGIAGLEDLCVVERKDLPDLMHSLSIERSAFVNRLKRMSHYPHRLLVITAGLSQIKSPILILQETRTVFFNHSLHSWPGLMSPFSAPRLMTWERKPWLRTCIRSTSISGLRTTTTAGFW